MVVRSPRRAAGKLQGSSMDKVPLNFGKRLAHADKKVRDRGVDMLKLWLQKHPELDRVDYLKLWNGLHLGLWMCNKQHVQQDLALSMALLIHDIPRCKQALWMDAFWETMQESSDKLDAKMVNRYCLLMRIVCAEAFRILRLGGWALPDVRSFAVTIRQGYVQHSSTCSGLRLVLEFNRIFWPELMPQLEPTPAPPVEAILELLKPMCTTASSSSLDSLVSSIHNQILRRTPASFCNALLFQLLPAASQKETPVKNQGYLTETIEVLRSRNAVSDNAALETGSLVPSCAPASENSRAAAGKKARKRRVALASLDVAATLEIDPVQTSVTKRRRKAVVSPRDSKGGFSGDVAVKSNQESPKCDMGAAKAKAAAVSEPPGRASALRMPKRRANSSVAQSPQRPNSSVAQSPHARAIRATKQGDAARHVVFDLQATQVVRYSESQHVAPQVRCVLRKPAASLPRGIRRSATVAGSFAAY